MWCATCFARETLFHILRAGCLVVLGWAGLGCGILWTILKRHAKEEKPIANCFGFARES